MKTKDITLKRLLKKILRPFFGIGIRALHIKVFGKYIFINRYTRRIPIFSQLLKRIESWARLVRTADDRHQDYQRWFKKHYPDKKQLELQKKDQKVFKKRPLISLLVPTFNTEISYLRECIESVISQSYDNWQLCIVDDKSTDSEVRSVIKQYAQKDKRTVVLVTHDMSAIRQYCNNAIIIDDGKLIAMGSPEKIAQSYQKLFSSQEKFAINDKGKAGTKKHWGSGILTVSKVTLHQGEKNLLLNCQYLVNNDVPAPVFGFTIYDSAGINILENNTTRLGFKTKDVKKGQTISMNWSIPNIFKNGLYTLSVACCDQPAVEFYEWLDDAVSFRVVKKLPTAGVVDPKMSIKNYEVV